MLDANVSLEIMEIAVGLEYLHHEQVVHGDLRGASLVLKLVYTPSS